tara:strand:+ start:103 stop:987 length:885 start_codon:yes stop_codon:yes gene_type:complete
MAFWAVAAPLISAGVGLWSSNRSSNAARDQANTANEATEAQYQYDLQAYRMASERLAADHNDTQNNVLLQQINERKRADFMDESALRRYNYDLMIRNRKQDSLEEQFWKSDDLFYQQLSLNARSAYSGREDQLRQLEEIEAEQAFEQQELHIENLLAQGKARARGQTGRSVTKSIQSIIAKEGRKQSAMAEAMLGAERNTRSVLMEIARDQEAADMSAWAQKMLHPGELPLPLAPLPTPVAEFQLPRPLEEFDFGPEPIRGAMRDPSAAASRAWTSGITSVASSLGQAASNWEI